MLVGHIDRIEPYRIGGWAADTDAPDSVEEVIVYVDGRRAARIACDLPRTDLRDRGDYGEGHHGFIWEASPPIPPYLLDRITVRFARSGMTVPRGEIKSAGGVSLNAILVTAPGRSGTTLAMHRLSRSPQICVAEAHPYEVRLLSYWSTVVATVTGPADYERSMHPDRLEGDGFKVGANPFSHMNYAAVFQASTLATEYFGTFVPQQLHDVTRTVISEYYLRVMDDRRKAEAIFFAEKNNNLDRRTRAFARRLFPDLREIVLVRDPRDLLCSQIAYFGRTPDQIMGQLTYATDQLMRIKREEGDQTLIVKYEDLILDREAVNDRVADYLGTKREHATSQADERASFGSHGTSESPAASIGRWKSELSEEQQSWCASNWEAFLAEFLYSRY
jgi:hypothetical protein